MAGLLLSSPAFALQLPEGGNADRRICDADYDPNNVTAVNAVVGDTVTIQFGAKERIAFVTPSDKAHLKYFLTEGGNVLWLKATMPMPPQPISVRTILPDGTPRLYALQWAAKPDQRARVALASNGTAAAASTASGEAACYVVRYRYPADEAAARAAAWRAQRDKARRQAAEIALHQQQGAAAHNVRYVARGDASIGPAEISDDGNTTTLVFPGTTRIPVILTVTPDGKESQVTGTTTEQGGVVKVHRTLPFIRLRDGDLTLCIWNLAHSAVGSNPGTGTTSAGVTRDVSRP